MKQIWNDVHGEVHPFTALDFLPREQMRGLQSQRLREIVKLAYEKVELYRNRMKENGVSPDDIKGIDDISKLPFMQKTDLRDTYPNGLFAVDMKDIVRVHASSGTTGKPIVVAYTDEDLKIWDSSIIRCLKMYGVNSGDVVQNCYGYGLFTGGLGLHDGSQALGCTVIPASGGNSERQLMLMQDLKTTVFASTPSYFMHLIEEGKSRGVDFKKLPLRIGVFGGEPSSDAMRKFIADNTNVIPYDIYGLSEIVGPGVGGECEHKCGIHILEDNYYPEIVDPDTGEVLPDGEEGELVLSTLTKHAMPVLRYRTHDITSIIAEPCKCGRTIRRISRISKRSDDMLIIRGVNVFPSQIEIGINRVEETTPNFRILREMKNDMESLTVEVEIQDKYYGDSLETIEKIRRKIQASIVQIVNIRIDVKIVEPNSIPRSQGKIKRVYDNRKV
ncbi:MAG: phenylacetate--CoA ligase [Opitutales bacterium]|nr:phenylacetate--CoA ligase [Opitutales bacterium]